jgi:hypothetical protein
VDFAFSHYQKPAQLVHALRTRLIPLFAETTNSTSQTSRIPQIAGVRHVLQYAPPLRTTYQIPNISLLRNQQRTSRFGGGSEGRSLKCVNFCEFSLHEWTESQDGYGKRSKSTDYQSSGPALNNNLSSIALFRSTRTSTYLSTYSTHQKPCQTCSRAQRQS